MGLAGMNPDNRIKPVRFLLLLAATLGVVASARGQTISPVIVELSRARPVVSVTITNGSDHVLRLQTDPLAWKQPDGVDHYEATDDIMAVPPVADIGPGAKQIFRVTLRRKIYAPDERAFRLVLEDVSDLSTAVPGDASVTLHVAHRLPVFVAGSVGGKAQPRLTLCAAGAPACVRIDNDGNHYLEVRKLTATRGSWHQDLAGTRVLAHAWRQWPLEPPAGAGGALKMVAETSAGPLIAEFELP
jgi:fimbrial chaperone protein